MASEQLIKGQIRQFIIDNFVFDDKANRLADEDSLLDEGIIDSTGILELVLFVEEKFGIRVDDEDVLPENFDSISKLTDYVGRKTAPLVAAS